MIQLLIASLSATALLASAPGRDPTLDQLLACHDRAVGGPALRAVRRIEYELAIEEQGMSLRARYRALREGTGGRMRIDVFAGEVRVFSEWWDGQRAWQLPQDAVEPVQARAEASEALRRGLEQPNHLWTLADMPRNGHHLAHEGRETIDGTAYHVLKLTLADGFATWYWVHPTSCRIERSRDFRAFHPDLDPARKWVEAVFDDFRTVRGVTRPYRERTLDVATGRTIATTRILALRLDPLVSADSAPVP